MPDVSMCMNEECPLRKECYRFTAVPSSDLQAYNYYKPDENGNCEAYWPHWQHYKNDKDEK